MLSYPLKRGLLQQANDIVYTFSALSYPLKMEASTTITLNPTIMISCHTPSKRGLLQLDTGSGQSVFVVIPPQNGGFYNFENKGKTITRCHTPSKWGLLQRQTVSQNCMLCCHTPSKWGLLQLKAAWATDSYSCHTPSKWELLQLDGAKVEVIVGCHTPSKWRLLQHSIVFRNINEL